MTVWAMRTSRDSDAHREYVRKELLDGRLRQGWGAHECQDLGLIQDLRDKGVALSSEQIGTRPHWRMGNGTGDYYMQDGELVVVPNMPHEGRFTICRVKGDYYFEVANEHGLGHVRPVEALTPQGVSNNHELVDARLRKSFGCPLRMWRITPYLGCLNVILNSSLQGEQLTVASSPVQRVKRVIDNELRLVAEKVGPVLPTRAQGEEWEPVLSYALERLFPVSVKKTGGPKEQGADVEIVIRNPFEVDRNWIVPVQVKDHTGTEGVGAVKQLERALESRRDRGRVIAVVLLVSDADASTELKKRMSDLEDQHGVPFIYCTGDRFRRLVSEGFLRRS